MMVCLRPVPPVVTIGPRYALQPPRKIPLDGGGLKITQEKRRVATNLRDRNRRNLSADYQ